MRNRELETTRDVVELIGRERLREITGKGNTNLSNWITVNRFPPETFYVMQLELRRLRKSAAPKLWRMIVPQTRAA